VDLSLWLAFVATSCALLVLPGPTVLLVLSCAMRQGRSVAFPAAAGVALGHTIAMTVSITGLGALVLISPELFSALKWCGAAFLCYIGARLILSVKEGVMTLPDTQSISSRQAFGRLAAVTALNPKSIAFFIAFVPQFVEPDAQSIPQVSLMVATFVALSALNATAYSCLADHLRVRMTSDGAMVWLIRASGATIMGMGLVTATFTGAAA